MGSLAYRSGDLDRTNAPRCFSSNITGCCHCSSSRLRSSVALEHGASPSVSRARRVRGALRNAREGSHDPIQTVRSLASLVGWARPCRSTRRARRPRAPPLLLSKARSLEARGRMDLAVQNWKQVLLVDPDQTEALAGLARSAKQEGDLQRMGMLLDRLRKVNPTGPEHCRHRADEACSCRPRSRNWIDGRPARHRPQVR